MSTSKVAVAVMKKAVYEHYKVSDIESLRKIAVEFACLAGNGNARATWEPVWNEELSQAERDAATKAEKLQVPDEFKTKVDELKNMKMEAVKNEVYNLVEVGNTEELKKVLNDREMEYGNLSKKVTWIKIWIDYENETGTRIKMSAADKAAAAEAAAAKAAAAEEAVRAKQLKDRLIELKAAAAKAAAEEVRAKQLKDRLIELKASAAKAAAQKPTRSEVSNMTEEEILAELAADVTSRRRAIAA